MKAVDEYHALLSHLPSGDLIAGLSSQIAARPNIEFEPEGTVVAEDHRPSPQDLRIFHHGSCGRFGSAECEWAAWAIVSFCRKRGGWVSFTKPEILQEFNSVHCGSMFAFDQFRVRGLIYAQDGVNFRVTDQFVEHANLP